MLVQIVRKATSSSCLFLPAVKIVSDTLLNVKVAARQREDLLGGDYRETEVPQNKMDFLPSK